LHEGDVAFIRNISAVNTVSGILIALLNLVENLLCHSFLIGKQGKKLDPFSKLMLSLISNNARPSMPYPYLVLQLTANGVA